MHDYDRLNMIIKWWEDIHWYRRFIYISLLLLVLWGFLAYLTPRTADQIEHYLYVLFPSIPLFEGNPTIVKIIGLLGLVSLISHSINIYQFFRDILGYDEDSSDNISKETAKNLIDEIISPAVANLEKNIEILDQNSVDYCYDSTGRRIGLHEPIDFSNIDPFL